MKKISVLLIFLFYGLSVFARIGEFRSLGDADICVVYKRTMVLDTINPDNRFKIDNLTLMAGKEGSAFYSEEKKMDLAMSDNPEYFQQKYSDQTLFTKIANFEKETIFRDYKKNICIDHQRYDLTNWELTEEIEKPEWIVGDSVINILGYDCIMATSTFRGRTWIAFFCPEIPISEGPWKLCGLPGLILRAFDDRQEYCYDAITINTKDLGIVEFYNYDDRLKIKNRQEGLRHRRKSMFENVNSKINALTGGALTIPSKVKSSQIKRYDFEETDYPHN
ncbi:MAG: GLPGLI family protein [Muribaculum sp.]|nr:GLPGLI family protein [Muribaculum sp.]